MTKSRACRLAFHFEAAGSRLAWLGHLGVVLALACAGDAEDDPRASRLAGGWSNDLHMFLCLAEDGRMWLGDSLTELAGPSPCSVHAGGTAFTCADGDDGSEFHGSIELIADELTLEVADCLAEPPECRATYRRNASLTCE